MNVLVVVDGGTKTLIVARLFRLLEITYVPNVGDGQSKRTGYMARILIVLVIHDQELLVVDVQDLALMRVGGAFVRCYRDDLWPSFIGDIICIN
jgi:hypothetical protein